MLSSMGKSSEITLANCIDAARAQLEATDIDYGQGSEDAEQEASWLVIHALDIEDNDIDSELDRPVSRDGQNK
ncbi:MAG TPA: hypothetical protein ENG78_02635, partial [Acidiferrobacteraceae bacterium]|nr:hypothetical protein [Acidiferrobacteraceae bacterium]HEX19705.1 hypothetical protein [Acidiferrobacteraceae bacterium]